jgi:hypothetical protein
LRDANIGLAKSVCVDEFKDLDFDLNKRSAKAREDAITEICHILAPPEHKKFFTPAKPALRVIEGAEAVS